MGGADNELIANPSVEAGRRKFSHFLTKYKADTRQELELRFLSSPRMFSII